jgi:hypothetical protein
MVELVTAAAVVLLIGAVVASFLPLVPSGLLSVAGIMVYWWGTGYTRPELWFLAGFLIVGLAAWAFDYLSGVVAAKAGGATTLNSVIGGIVGFLLFLAFGPIGLLVGVAGTVFLLEMRRTDDAEGSLKAGVYSAVGVLGSSVVQFVLTFSLLVAFAVALLV